MNLAVSNIAWPPELDASVYPMLVAHGIGAVEVAPTRHWPHWQGITAQAASGVRRAAEDAGLRISSLQSILFQKPELRLFGSTPDREALYQHVARCAHLAEQLGAECVIFGAPKNRDRGSLSEADALAIATEFFSRVGSYYAGCGVCLGFEPNPIQYGCNFATDSVVAARLVRAVASPGFRLHLDSACLHLAGEDTAAVLDETADVLCHFHVSEPYLGGFSTPEVAHRNIAASLQAYHHWVALEMRATESPLAALEEAVCFLRTTYGN